MVFKDGESQDSYARAYESVYSVNDFSPSNCHLLVGVSMVLRMEKAEIRMPRHTNLFTPQTISSPQIAICL